MINDHRGVAQALSSTLHFRLQKMGPQRNIKLYQKPRPLLVRLPVRTAPLQQLRIKPQVYADGTVSPLTRHLWCIYLLDRNNFIKPA